MRIVELVNSLDEIGGAEWMLVHLALALKSRGHDVSVACLRNTGGALADMLEASHVPVVPFRKGSGPSPGVALRLARYLHATRADVVHGHNPLVHHYALASGKMARTPVIVNTIHGIGNLSEKPGLKEFLYRLACGWSGATVAVCPFVFREFARRRAIPEESFVVINNGIPLDPFLSIPRRIPDGKTVFGIVGRLTEVKGHATLLDALSRLAAQRDDVRLEILGDGPLRDQLTSQVGRTGLSGRVNFHGFSTDVSGFLKKIDCGVMSSLSEGLPLSVIEYMAAGLPVVSTDVGGIRDLVDGARAGWLCDSGDAQALHRALAAAVEAGPAERASLGDRARRFVEQNHSLDGMTDAYEGLFRRIAGDANR
jgi:glycosyltransferase involved in cell wall biosynthesis